MELGTENLLVVPNMKPTGIIFFQLLDILLTTVGHLKLDTGSDYGQWNRLDSPILAFFCRVVGVPTVVTFKALAQNVQDTAFLEALAQNVQD